MLKALGDKTGTLFLKFMSLCFSSFAALRRNSCELIAYLSTSAGRFGGPTATRYVQEKLMLEFEETVALQAFERIIYKSIESVFPDSYEALRRLVRDHQQ